MEQELLARYQKVAEQAYTAQLAAYTEHSKWILASLLTLNAGALIVFCQIATIAPEVRHSFAPICFVLGALIAVLSGIAARKQTLGISGAFMTFLTADDDNARVAALQAGSDKDKRLALTAELAAYTSGAAFLAGALFTWAATIPQTHPI